MNDPSDGVPQMLLNHVHLISTHQYPYEPATMQMEKALNYLMQAPKIVRDMAAVAWQYLAPPPADGKVFLMWQPINKLGAQFATDGYVWAEAEIMYSQQVRGYTMEVLVHEAGFNPGMEQMATHRRMRYRLTAGPNGQPVDAGLEIVHYCKAFPEHQQNARQVRTHPQLQKFMAERRFLESQGSLVRKQFMLHDRDNWPKLGMPGAVPGNPYQQNMMYGAGRGAPPPGSAGGPFGQRPGMTPATAAAAAAAAAGGTGSMGPSPAKRARTSTSRPAPPGLAAGAAQLPEDAVFAEEEMQGVGDSLDLLTPREISETRYKQHHEWMEEILSSPFATGQIEPNALTIGLAGEMGTLTDGVLNEKSDGPNSAPKPRKIGPDQVAELEKRVNAFLKKGEEDLSSMRSQHTKRMEEFGRQKLFADLERRLADIPVEGTSNEKLDGIVREAESKTGTTLTTGENIVQVSKGGILTAEEQLEALRTHHPVTTTSTTDNPDESGANADTTNNDDSNNNKTNNNNENETTENTENQDTNPLNEHDTSVDNLIDTDINMDLNAAADDLLVTEPDTHDVFNDDNVENEFPEYTNLDTAGEALDIYNDEYGSFNPS